jgi:hypothetical protein
MPYDRLLKFNRIKPHRPDQNEIIQLLAYSGEIDQ